MPKIYLKVKAVIFDMDGVITNTMPDHHKAWRAVLQKYDISVTHYDVYTREGQPGDEALIELCQKYNRKWTPHFIQKALKEKEEHFKKNAKTRFISGSRSFVKKLKKRGFLLALVTGTARHEVHEILPERLYNLFDVIVTGSDVRTGKPNPEPFNKACEFLRIKKSEGVVIENAPFGIRSAKSAGLKCLALETSLPKKFLNQADAVFSSFQSLERNVQLELK